jgi:hypothetical protein
MSLSSPAGNENMIATNPLNVMLSESEASAFPMARQSRFFGCASE